MKVKLLIKVLFIFLTLSLCEGCLLGMVAVKIIDYRHSATARFHVIVKDAETKVPMKGVHVQAEFLSIYGGLGKTSDSLSIDEGYTDANGKCTVSGLMNIPDGAIAGVNDLPGYYTGFVKPKFEDNSILKLNRWQPDGQVFELFLEKIENQIPLFVWKAKIRKEVPIESWWPIEEKISYDLMEGDWMPPLGKGKYADITFKRYPRISLGIGKNPVAKGEAFIDRMTVVFNGDGNGICEMPILPTSALKIRNAPVEGYENERTFESKKDLHLNFTKSNDNKIGLCFRIRTKKNKKGDIIEAYYGKMYNDFGVLYIPHYRSGGVKFTYYLNPILNDRNLEWDKKTNLCTKECWENLLRLER